MTIKTQSQIVGQDAGCLRLGAAAALVGVSRPTLAAAVDRGEVPGGRRGSQRVVQRPDLLAWAAGRAKPRGKRSSKRAAGRLVREITASLTDGYALGGYAVISERHPRYVLAPTATTVWATHRRFIELLDRTRPGDVLCNESNEPVAIWRFRNDESVRVLPWPASLGNLVAERGSIDRSLTPDRLLILFALEQALRAQEQDADLETLAVLVLERRTNLSAVLDALNKAENSSADCLAIPLGIRASSIVEASLAETARSARQLIANVLRRIANAGAANPSATHHRGELRPLGRSAWRDFVHHAEPAPIDDDRLLSLIGSV